LDQQQLPWTADRSLLSKLSGFSSDFIRNFVHPRYVNPVVSQLGERKASKSFGHFSKLEWRPMLTYLNPRSS